MVGYTPSISAAVWMGSDSTSQPIVNAQGKIIYGSGLPGAIWQKFMDAALAGTPKEALPAKSIIKGDTGKAVAEPTTQARATSANRAPATTTRDAPTTTTEPTPTPEITTPSSTPSPTPSSSGPVTVAPGRGGDGRGGDGRGGDGTPLIPGSSGNAHAAPNG
jgi:membrane peptidoglycan carboxypeptidase